MYRRPKFLEVLLGIRQEMAGEAGHDVERFVEIVRTGDVDARPRRRPAERMMAEAEMPTRPARKLAASRD